MANKIKKGDQVVVLTGKDKGRRGAVKQVLASEDSTRVVIEGVNLVKKHVRPNPQKDDTGGVKEIEASIDISNVAIFNAATQKADRVGFKTLTDGRKVRIYKSNQEQIDV